LSDVRQAFVGYFSEFRALFLGIACILSIGIADKPYTKYGGWVVVWWNCGGDIGFVLWFFWDFFGIVFLKFCGKTRLWEFQRIKKLVRSIMAAGLLAALRTI